MSVSDKWWFYHENKAAFPLTGVQPCLYVCLILQSKLKFLILVFFEIESVLFESNNSCQSFVKIESLGEFFFLAIMSSQLVGGSQIH